MSNFPVSKKTHPWIISEVRSPTTYPSMDEWKDEVQCQPQKHIDSAKIPYSHMTSPMLYWVIPEVDFSLNIRNTHESKLLIVGNASDRQNIHSTAPCLYNSQIVKPIDTKLKFKSFLSINELPNISSPLAGYPIATAHSNEVAVCVVFLELLTVARR